jgi:hypothetical protein
MYAADICNVSCEVVRPARTLTQEAAKSMMRSMVTTKMTMGYLGV